MTHQEKVAFKVKLKNFGLHTLTQRISTAQIAMDRAQEAANTEDKSSAGDKYETGRAMGQLEKEMYGRQLAEYAKEIDALRKISVDALYTHVAAGVFVQATGIAFFVSAGLGKQQVDGLTVLFVSPAAPLARSLFGKGPGDVILFNGARLVIEELF